MPDLTPLEAAEKLEELSAELANQPETWQQMICLVAASYLRKIAAGEYKPVVHCKLKEDCLNDSVYCPECGKRAHRTYACCPYCGCWFDGKDDSHV